MHSYSRRKSKGTLGDAEHCSHVQAIQPPPPPPNPHLPPNPPFLFPPHQLGQCTETLSKEVSLRDRGKRFQSGNNFIKLMSWGWAQGAKGVIFHL